VKCFTYEGAYATREENLKGTIEPGKLADITILPVDITKNCFKLKTTKPAEIEETKKKNKELKVFMTILNGEIVYSC
jgi:predicted amidohydrolase YtcJ